MNFPLIRFALWTILSGLPFAWYAIAGVRYPESIVGLSYLVALGAVILGTMAKVPLRAGSDPTLFPVRASAGCSSMAVPGFAVMLLWAMPHLEPRTSQLLLLVVGAISLLSLLAFTTISRVLRDTPRP